MGHYATGPGPRRGGLWPWPLLRDGDRLPVLIDWPETGKARAPENWPQICIYIPVVGRCRAAPGIEREEGMTSCERIAGGGRGRSEERRVGDRVVGTCRIRWVPS